MSSITPQGGRPQPSSLVDVLDRVLDKGLVIAGDIQVNLVDIELLTIKLRLLIASVDKAQELGIRWWDGDPFISSKARSLTTENDELRQRITELERRLGALTDGNGEDAGGDDR
jgi:hypothetical protein